MSREVEISGLICIKNLSLGIRLGWNGGWLRCGAFITTGLSKASLPKGGVCLGGRVGGGDGHNRQRIKTDSAEVGLQQDCVGKTTKQ